MAGKGISINFLADVRQFLRGTDDVEDALEKVSDSLDDAARDGDDATEKLERSFRDLTDVAKRESGQAADALSKNMKDAGGDASKALEQVADDGFSNAKEVAASFDGSAESIVEGFQGAAAEAFSGFGPAGAVAGLLAAAGLGLALQAVTEQQEAADALKESLTSAYREAATEGRKYLDQAAIDAQVLDILFDSGRREAAFADAAKIGADPNTYIRALAGDAEALEYAIEQATSASGNLVQELDSARGGESWSPAVQAIDLVRDRLIGLQVQHQQNQEAAEQYTEITAQGEREQREQIARTRATDQSRWEAAARQYGVELPSPVVQVQVEAPSIDALVSRLQREANARRIRIPGSVFTRNGTEVF